MDWTIRKKSTLTKLCLRKPRSIHHSIHRFGSLIKQENKTNKPALMTGEFLDLGAKSCSSDSLTQLKKNQVE